MTDFVYVGNAGSRDITVLALDDHGGLSPLATVPVEGLVQEGEASPMALSPGGEFLYAGFRDDPFSIVSFARDPATGALTERGRAAADDRLCYLAPDPSGRFLLGASYHGSKVTVNAIGRDGVVGETVQVFPARPNTHCVLPAPSGRFVLHTSLGDDVVQQARFDPDTGQLTPNDPSAHAVRPGAGPRHLAFSHDGRFVYLLCERDGSLYVFPYDADTGTLGEQTQVALSTPPGFSGTPTAADLHLTPDGRYLYASERTSGTLAAFRVHPHDGTLTAFASYPTVMEPRGFRIAPSGRCLVVAGTKSNSVLCYALNPETGALKTVGEYPAGQNANWVEIAPRR